MSDSRVRQQANEMHMRGPAPLAAIFHLSSSHIHLLLQTGSKPSKCPRSSLPPLGC